MGSFFTSVVATLLPAGVSDAVAAIDVPKVYVPNSSHDPEEVGMALGDRVRTLIRYLRAGASRGVDVGAVLQYVMIDVAGAGVRGAQVREIERMGVRVLDVHLMGEAGAPYVDDVLLIEALLSLV
jgi:hypothetical protein